MLIVVIVIFLLRSGCVLVSDGQQSEEQLKQMVSNYAISLKIFIKFLEFEKFFGSS